MRAEEGAAFEDWSYVRHVGLPVVSPSPDRTGKQFSANEHRRRDARGASAAIAGRVIVIYHGDGEAAPILFGLARDRWPASDWDHG